MMAWKLACGVALGAAITAAAEADVTYTFEDLALNTAVTMQYTGVTFSVQPQSCVGSPTLYMRIKNPTGGTSSGAKALQIDTGCPDFSPDYLRMVFDIGQSAVSFTVGDVAATYQVRAYSTTSGAAGLLSTQNIVVSGSGYVGVYKTVHVTSATANIRRVEVDQPVDLFESIDDLTFQPDPTPPLAAITAPMPNACVCGTVLIRGTANDPDGTYLGDRAEYRAFTDSEWTLIGTGSIAVTDGLLYSWSTAALSEGLYFVKLTVDNQTELSSSAVTSVWVSRNFDTVTFSLPAIVGGTACPDGTVWDNWCGTESYTVDYALSGSGTYLPVDAAMPTYAGSKINEQLATWATPAVDGAYTVRVVGSNACDNSRTTTHAVVVDNTPPTAFLTTPTPCQGLGLASSVPVRGTASDAHFGGWSLAYSGGPFTTWQPIASGAAPVANALFANWNTAGLPRCAYALRLTVWDTAVRDCNAAAHNQTEYVVNVDLGCDADYNRSGLVSVQDIFDFLDDYFAGCP